MRGINKELNSSVLHLCDISHVLVCVCGCVFQCVLEPSWCACGFNFWACVVYHFYCCSPVAVDSLHPNFSQSLSYAVRPCYNCSYSECFRVVGEID